MKRKRKRRMKKNEKSRQGKSVRFKRQPVLSVAPSQGPDKRTASFDEAEQSSKRRRVGPLPPSQAVEEPAIAEHTTASDKTEEADIETRGNPPASALVVPEAPVLSAPDPFRWADVRNPGRPLLCIIQVNYSSRVGSLAEDTKEWAFQLTFDAGRRRIPTMNMSIFSNGIAGPQRGRTAWCLGDYIEGDWMVTDFKIHRVADRARDRRIAHNKILAACKTDEDWARLVCISLEAWPKILGHFSGYGRCRNPNEGVKELFSAVFEGRRPYHLFIWFLAPDNLEAFERQCLSYFTRYFEQRKLPHEDFHDADDVSFAEHLQAQEQASST